MERYKSSGKTGGLFFVYGIAGIAAIAATSWLYQKLLEWIPLIYVSFLATLGFAAAVFFVAFLIGSLGHNRSALLGAFLGLVIGCAGLFGSHYVAYRGMVDRATDSIVDSVEDLGQSITREDARKRLGKVGMGTYIDVRVESGWSVGRRGRSGQFNGALVWIIWGIEALVLVGAGLIGGWSATSEIYCESCKAWIDGGDHLLARWDLDAQAVHDLEQAQRVDDIVRIASSPPGGRQLSQYVEFKSTYCAKCKQTMYLTVTKHWSEPNKEGGTDDHQDDLHANVVVTPELVGQLSELGRSHPAPDAHPPA